MGIIYAPAEGPDIKAIIQINEMVFPEMYDALFHGQLQPETIDALVEQRIQQMAKEKEKVEKSQVAGAAPLAQRFFAFKAVDEETGEIVGEARWMVYYEDEKLTKNIEEEAMERGETPMPQVNAEATCAWQRLLSKLKRLVLAVPEEAIDGKNKTEKEGEGDGLVSGDGIEISEADLDKVTTLRKRVYLSVLAVHPTYQRKGIGRKLLQWGLDEADRLGIAAYLEASTNGRHLYEQMGFKQLKELKFDLTPFGKELTVPVLPMMREPRLPN